MTFLLHLCRRRQSEITGKENDKKSSDTTVDAAGDAGADNASIEDSKAQSTEEAAEKIVEQKAAMVSEKPIQVRRVEYAEGGSPNSHYPEMQKTYKSFQGDAVPTANAATSPRPVMVRKPTPPARPRMVPVPILRNVRRPYETVLDETEDTGSASNKPPAIVVFGQQPLIEIRAMTPPSALRSASPNTRFEPGLKQEGNQTKGHVFPETTTSTRTLPLYGDPLTRAAQYAATHSVKEPLDEWDEMEWLEMVKNSPDVSVHESSPRGRTVKTGYLSSRSSSRGRSASPSTGCQYDRDVSPSFVIRDFDLQDNVRIITNDPNGPRVLKTVPRQTPVDYGQPPMPYYASNYTQTYPLPQSHGHTFQYPANVMYPSRFQRRGRLSPIYEYPHEAPFSATFDDGPRTASPHREMHGAVNQSVQTQPVQSNSSSPLSEEQKNKIETQSNLGPEERKALNILMKAIKCFKNHQVSSGSELSETFAATLDLQPGGFNEL